jgi:hypothetical protein
MTTDQRLFNPKILQKARQSLEQRFATKLDILAVEFLSEPERRNIVLRLRIKGLTKTIPSSIILKQSLTEKSSASDKDAYARFARDWAGLEFVTTISQNTHNVPRFYGGNKKYRFILIEDLGSKHISLVDSLTQPCSDVAILALTRFMKALGSFHAASFGHSPLYEKILKNIHGDSETLEDDCDFSLRDLIEKLQCTHKLLHLDLSTECIREAENLIRSQLQPGPFTVLTHGDICPDNVFDHKENQDLQLIDFEWASLRSALLDGTYLRMSMPTCWCVKAIPNEVINSLELIYREELKSTIPAAKDDSAYLKAYTEACGFWVLQQTLPYIDSVLDEDRVGPSGPVPENSLWKSEENWVRPRVLYRLQAFIDLSSGKSLLPNLHHMAVTLLALLIKRWPDTKPLEFYPSFWPLNNSM